MQNASSVESSVLNADRRRSSNSINNNKHHQDYPIHSTESSLDSSPLPSRSNSIANVKAWLNDQSARSNPNLTQTLFNSTHPTSNPNPASNSNPIPDRNSVLNPTTRTSSPAPSLNSISTSAPPNINISHDQSVLPPVNHGPEVWNQLYDAMHNENQKLRARLTEAERKSEVFRKENVALKQQLESLTSTTSDPTRATAVSTSTSTSTSTNSPNPQSSNIANTALRDVYAPSSSSQQRQRYQLPSGFSVGGYSSSRRSSAFELNSNHHSSSSKKDWDSKKDGKSNDKKLNDPRSSSSGNDGGEGHLQSPTISEPIIRDPFNGIINQIEPNSTSSNQFQSQLSNKRPQPQSMNTLIPNPHGAGWHDHALSGFDSGSSRLTWSQAGELTDRVGSDDGFSNGSGYGFNLAKSPKKNFELHLPKEKEKGKGKEKEKENGNGKVDESNQGYFIGSKENSNREENPSSSINSWASNLISENPNSSSTNFLTTSTTTSIDSRTFNNNFLESSLPNTSSWGELISAHVAHLHDTLPYAVVEKDRLERILASSSSGGSSLSNGNNLGGFGMQRGGLGKSTSSNGNSMNEMSRSNSKTSEGSKIVINISSSKSGQSPSMTMENEDRGNPSILTSLPLDDDNQISTTSRAAPSISLNANDKGKDPNDITKETEEEIEPVGRNHSGTETEKG